MNNFNPAITEKLNNLSSNLLDGHYIFSRDFDEVYLAKRFAKPDVWPHNISYEVSTNEKHIEQYYKIREEAYKTLIGEEYYAAKDEHDNHSYKFLALAGGNCVGGIRITMSEPESPVALPLEDEDFQLRELYKKINFNNLTYCEASRLALLPDFRNGNILGRLFEETTTFGINDLNIQIVFGRSAGIQTRIFQNHYRNMGFNLIIRKDIIMPVQTLEHLKIQLWAIDVTPDQRYVSTLKSYNVESERAESKEFA